ncbi:MAG: hypothetical protein Q8O88_04060 [bacterium]|nr:hypothetical protein [bacterium]
MKDEKLISGDTVSINGISGVLFVNSRLDIVSIRPVPALKMTEEATLFCDSRGLQYYITGKLGLYHLENFEQFELLHNKRIVLVEKSTEHLMRVDKTKTKIIKK